MTDINNDLQIIRIPGVSNMKGKITLDKFSINNITFELSFFARFIAPNPFALNVTCNATTYGRLFLKIFKEDNPEKCAIFDVMINLSFNTQTPCRFKNLNYNQIKDYVTNDTLAIGFNFIPKEKTASPIINSSKNENNKRINEKISQISRLRQYIGYVGLFNSGCTCYMNSMLQTLFNIPIFRRLIYNLETNEQKDIKVDIIKNLQFLFYQLQTSKKTCNTKALETSFGWTSRDLGVQHDVQEFFTVFLDAILSKAKNTDSYNQIKDLFQIQTKSYLENKLYGFHYNLPDQDQYAYRLTIMPDKSLQEMLNDIIIEPTEYNIPNVGNQICNRIEYISKLPKILFIHLIRTTYDIERDEMVRVSLPVKYEENITIHYNNGAQTVDYQLHAILVHHGSTAGHYTAIVRPTTAGDWIEFNDLYVSRLSQREALDQQNDCYLLVYGQTETAAEDFKKVEDEEIPEKVRALEQFMQHDETEISLITIADCEKLCSQFRCDYLPQDPMKIPIGKQETTATLYQKIGDFFQFGINFTLWQCRRNGTPLNAIPQNSEPISKYVQTDMVFVETGDYTNGVNMLTMMKYFDHTEQKLYFLGSLNLLKTTKPSDLFPQIREMSKIEKAQNLIVFFESSNGNPCIQIDPNAPVSSINGFECGSTLIFQQAGPPLITEQDESIISFYSQQECTYINYLSYEMYSVSASLLVDGEPFPLKYPYDLTIAQFKQFIAPILGLDGNFDNTDIVLFFEEYHDYFISSLSMDDKARQPFSPNYSRDPSAYSYPKKIGLKVTDKSSTVLHENYESIVMYYSDDSFTVDDIFYLVELKEKTIKEILDNLNMSDKKLRISLMGSGRIESEIDINTPIQMLDHQKVVRIDQIAEDVPNNMRYIIVNIDIDKRSTDDIYPEKHMSFYLPLFEGEPFSDLKERIKLIADFDDDNIFAKLRFQISKDSSTPGDNNPPILKNDAILANIEGQFTLQVSRPYQYTNQALKIYT